MSENNAVEEGVVEQPQQPAAQPEQHSNAEWARLRIAEKQAKEAEEARQKAEADKAEVEKQLQEIRATTASKEEVDAQINKMLILNRLGVSLEIKDHIKSTDEAGIKAEVELLRRGFAPAVVVAPQPDPQPTAQDPAPKPIADPLANRPAPAGQEQPVDVKKLTPKERLARAEAQLDQIQWPTG